MLIATLLGGAAILAVRADDRAADPAKEAANPARPAEPVDPSTADAAEDAEDDDPRRQLYTGEVVLVTEALKRRGIKAYDEMQGQAVLETFDGRLFPIVSDWRGRAFYQDERLRNRKVELVCLERPGIPYLQVISVFTFDDEDRRTYTDYWCDVCAIPMYEIKPCDCCQEETRLRFTLQGLPDYLEGEARVPVGRASDGETE